MTGRGAFTLVVSTALRGAVLICSGSHAVAWADRCHLFPICDRLAARYRQLEAAIRFHGGTKVGCGDRIRTCDLQLMRLASYRAALRRRKRQARVVATTICGTGFLYGIPNQGFP